jgi:hypothetical protein
MKLSKHFITRAYNKIILKPDKGVIVKNSLDSKLINETLYYKALPKKLKRYFPNIINSFTKNKKNYLEIEYFPYKNLGDLMVFEKFKSQIWSKIAIYINNILNDFNQFSYKKKITNDIIHMYIKKTEKEFLRFENFNLKSKEICNYKELIINKKKYKNFKEMWPRIKEFILKKFSNRQSSVIHGDFCLSNILYCEHNKNIQLKLIDPRGSFGQLRYMGDRLYDIAKIRHSFSGYEYFIYDQFRLSQNQNNYRLILNNKNYLKISKIFKKKIINDFDSQKSSLIEGTIFIGMCARHYDSFKRQIAMYLTGIKILNNVYKEI